MIKVLIIDDEPIIREGLKRTIDWGRLNCEVAGEAENGVEAVEKINSLLPDILITDIMMPGLSGLELIKYIKESHPHIKVIFLTGYNNFSFAQQAIKLGAFDFVLKPTNTQELEGVVVKARDSIIRSNIELQQVENLKRKIDESLPVLKDKFVSDLLYNNINSVEEVNKKMQFFNIRIEKYIIMCVQIDNYNEFCTKYTEEEKIMYLFSIKEKTIELLNRCKIQHIISCNQDTFAVILQFAREESEELLKGSIISIAEELRNKVENIFPLTISVGISHYYKNINDIKSAYREAVTCLGNRFYIGSNSTIHIDDIFNFESVSGFNEVDTVSILEAIKFGNIEKIKIELDNMLMLLSKTNNQTYIRNTCIEIVVASVRLYCEIYGSIDDVFEEGGIPFEKLMGCGTAAELFKIVERAVNSISDSIMEKQHSQTRKVIAKALDFINSHYHKDITLNDLADYVFMSQWYFSKLFKKEIGETFSEFLLKVRLDKAKELLKGSLELKTYEVAEKVGFNDARYFGQIFKKVTGMTPSEFRESA